MRDTPVFRYLAMISSRVLGLGFASAEPPSNNFSLSASFSGNLKDKLSNEK